MRLKTFSTVSVLVLSTALGTTLMSVTAHAGFEFVAPKKVIPVQEEAAPAPLVAVPNDKVQAEPLPVYNPAPVASSGMTVEAPLRQPPRMAVPVTPAAPVAAPQPLTPVAPPSSDALVMDHGTPPQAVSRETVQRTVSPEGVVTTKTQQSIIWDSTKPDITPTNLVQDGGFEAPAPIAAAPVVTAPVAAEPAPIVAAPVAAAPTTLAEGPVAEGFGRNVPLALALQQIVPSNYRYSFGEGTNPGMRISWNGGKPWKTVITDIARDNDMNVDIVGDVIAFHKGGVARDITVPSAAPSGNTLLDAPAPAQDITVLPPLDTTITPPPAADAGPAWPSPINGGTDISGENPDDVVTPLGSISDSAPASAPAPAPALAPASSVDSETAILWDNAGVENPAPVTTDMLDTSVAAAAAPSAPVASSVADSAEDLPAASRVKKKQIMVADEYNFTAPLPAQEPALAAVTEPAPLSTDELAPVAATSSATQMDAVIQSATGDELGGGDTAPASVPAGDTPAPAESVAPPAIENNLLMDQPVAPGVAPEMPKADAEPLSLLDKLNAAKNEASKPDAAALPAAEVKLPDLDSTVESTTVKSSTTELAMVNTSASAEMAPAPVADLNSVQEWRGQKDATLRQVLTEWSQRSGVSLVWSSEYDYPLETDVNIKANYPEAVRTLLAGFAKAQPRPLGRFFKNQDAGAQPVLVVETQRLTN